MGPGKRHFAAFFRAFFPRSPPSSTSPFPGSFVLMYPKRLSLNQLCDDTTLITAHLSIFNSGSLLPFRYFQQGPESIKFREIYFTLYLKLRKLSISHFLETSEDDKRWLERECAYFHEENLFCLSLWLSLNSQPFLSWRPLEKPAENHIWSPWRKWEEMTSKHFFALFFPFSLGLSQKRDTKFKRCNLCFFFSFCLDIDR